MTAETRPSSPIIEAARIATNPQLTPDEQRHEIEIAEKPWHQFMARVVSGLKGRSPEQAAQILEAARRQKPTVLGSEQSEEE